MAKNGRPIAVYGENTVIPVNKVHKRRIFLFVMMATWLPVGGCIPLLGTHAYHTKIGIDSTLPHNQSQSLADIKLCYNLCGKVAFDLPLPEGMLAQFEKETGFRQENINFKTDNLSEEQEQWIISHSNVTKGKLYGLFSLEKGTFEYAVIQGIMWNPTEGSPPFSVILDSNRSLDPLKVWSCHVTDLAFSAEIAMPTPARAYLLSDPKVLFSIQKMIRENGLIGKVCLAYRAYAKYPRMSCTLVILQVGEKKYLSCWTPEEKMIETSVKYPYLKVVPEGLVIEDREPWDHGLWNPAVYVLPDLNGDGGNEIFVSVDATCTGILLSIGCNHNGSIVVTEVTTHYVGP